MAVEPTPETCFRHSDRVTGRHCTRCGRPACAECLVDAPVGAQCVDCVKAAAPSRSQRLALQWRGANLVMTKTLIGINVVAFVLIGLRDGRFDGNGRTSANLALFGPAVHNGEWWRLFTSSAVHYGVFHLFSNMLVLWIVGMVLEPAAGRLRFALLYVVSVLAGAAGALLLDPHAFTGGASGGVFGLAAAATVLLWRHGLRFWDTGFGPLIIINVIISFTIPGISIGGHLGGLVGGGLAAEAMLQARRAEQRWAGIAATVFIGIGSVLIAFAAAAR